MGMKDSPRLQRLLNDVGLGFSDKQLDSFRQELMNMHKTRKTRSLRVKDVISETQLTLIDAVNQSNAYRSRCLDILESCENAIGDLEYHAEKVSLFLMSTYPKALSKFKTVGERQNYVWSLLGPVYDKVNTLKKVKRLAEMVIEDIDQSGWNVERMIKVLNISSKTERHI